MNKKILIVFTVILTLISVYTQNISLPMNASQVSNIGTIPETQYEDISLTRYIRGQIKGDIINAAFYKNLEISKQIAKQAQLADETSKRDRKRIRETFAYQISGSDKLSTVLRKYLGTKYVYGAQSRSATDCSGLVLQVYRELGINLPRTSREQSKVGKKVSKANLEPGDLLFYGSGHVSHVGIYLGSNMMIHASSGRGKVVIADINQKYYTRRFISARRVK